MTEDQVLTYLRDNKGKLNFQGIATTAGIGHRTLHDYVEGKRGKRGLSPEVVAGLARAIEELRPPWAAPQQPA